MELVEATPVTGRLFAVQIKSGTSYFSNPTAGGWCRTATFTRLRHNGRMATPIDLEHAGVPVEWVENLTA